MSKKQRQDKILNLLERAAQFMEEQAPDATWWKEYFQVIGVHMILTEEGWESGESKWAYMQSDPEWKPLDEVNG